MKAKTLLSILALFCLIVSCQTSAFTYNNDIFTKSTDSQYQTRKAKPVQTQSEKENLYYDDYLVEEEEFYDDVSGTANVILVAVDDFDAYDYFWTARLRRFHTHVSYGWGFYDPFYTNMFWYTNSPSMWGVSIYLGYSWWWPSPFYRPWYFNYGWHNWGWSYGWGWGWHQPWRFGGPWGGWSEGFNAGFWAGYYHNSFDRNRSFFYGHRNTVGGPSTGRNSTRRVFGSNDDETIRRTSRSVTGDSFNQRYETISRSEGTGRGETGTVTRNDVSSERGATTTRQTETRTTTTPTTRQTETRTTTTPTTRQTETRTTTPTTPSTRQTETRTTTTPTTPSTRQTETRPSAPPSTPSTRQDTYNSGFRPDNSRNTPTHTPPSSRNSGSSFSSPSSSGSGFSSPSSGGSRSSGSSSPSGGSSSGGSRSSGGSSGNTRR